MSRTMKVIWVAVIISSVLPTTVAAGGKAGDVAIGVEVSSVEFNLPFRIWASHRFTFDPTIGFSYESPPTDKDTLRLQLGLGMMYHGRPGNDLRPYVGLRFDVNILSNTSVAATDVFITPIVGAEYFLSNRFSFSGEFLLEIGFTDSKVAATGGLSTDTQLVRTRQRLMVFFYL